MLDSLEKHLKVAAAATALLAAVVYGTAYFALSRYYSVFGLTPEDAGVTQTTLIARAATGFSLLGVGFVIAGLAAAYAVAGFRALPLASATASWSAIAGSLVLFALAVGAFFLLPALAALLLGFVLAGGAIGVGVAPEAKATSGEPGAGAPRRYAVVLAAVVVVTFAVNQVVSAAENSRNHVLQHGDFSRESSWQRLMRMSLGIEVRAVSHDEQQLGCARLVARSGDRAWVLQRDGAELTVLPLKTDEVKLAYVNAEDPCWQD